MLTISERKLIIRLHKQGKKQEVIASIIGCSQQTVSKWVRESKSRETFESLPRSGRPTKLTNSKLTELRDLLKHKIEQKNAQFGSVTTKELRAFIHAEIGELYTIRHIERLMHKMGFSLITPRTMHIKHNQNAVELFREELKKKSSQSIWVMK